VGERLNTVPAAMDSTPQANPRENSSLATPVRLSRTSTALRRAAPAPGADTEEVLIEYGYRAEEIAKLKASGVLGGKQATSGKGVSR